MIKANELRIGNWILPEHNLDGDFHLVTGIGEGSVNGYIQDWYSPIPLTPEILEKCGFEATNGIEIKNYIWLVIHCDSGEANIYNIYKNETLQLRIECKYLHQLQNLYFALTGEELVFNYATEPVLPS